MPVAKSFTCLTCDKTFQASRKRKYCTPKCRPKVVKKNKFNRRASKKPKKETLSQFIINKFLKNPKATWKEKGLKFRELKFVERLIKLYNLEVFWRALPVPFLADSLGWYLAPSGREYLKIEFAKFSLDLTPHTSHNISAVKFGEDKTIKRKPKTLRDFLNNGSKKEDS